VAADGRRHGFVDPTERLAECQFALIRKTGWIYWQLRQSLAGCIRSLRLENWKKLGDLGFAPVGIFRHALSAKPGGDSTKISPKTTAKSCGFEKLRILAQERRV
jgi:hypothetical protein